MTKDKIDTPFMMKTAENPAVPPCFKQGLWRLRVLGQDIGCIAGVAQCDI